MKWLDSLLLATAAVLAPIRAVVIATVVLVFIDLITGIMAAKKQGKKITSSGFNRTIAKLFLYQTAILMAFLVQQYFTGDTFPASKIVSALIGLTELSSVLENINILSGTNLFKVVLARISRESKKDQ